MKKCKYADIHTHRSHLLKWDWMLANRNKNQWMLMILCVCWMCPNFIKWWYVSWCLFCCPQVAKTVTDRRFPNSFHAHALIVLSHRSVTEVSVTEAYGLLHLTFIQVLSQLALNIICSATALSFMLGSTQSESRLSQNPLTSSTIQRNHPRHKSDEARVSVNCQPSADDCQTYGATN